MHVRGTFYLGRRKEGRREEREGGRKSPQTRAWSGSSGMNESIRTELRAPLVDVWGVGGVCMSLLLDPG